MKSVLQASHQTERSTRTTSRRLINHLPNLNMNCTLWLEDAGGGGGGASSELS